MSTIVDVEDVPAEVPQPAGARSTVSVAARTTESAAKPAAAPEFDLSTFRMTRITDNYLEEMEAELNKEPEKPRKKTKAEKRAERREKRRIQAIADKKLVMRDELRRELELGKRMDKRGFEEWHEMCKEIKLTEMKQELIAWGELVERNIERKDDHITMLLDDMEQTQEQHTRCFGKTIELIDHIRNCFHVMLHSVKQLYEQQAEELLRDFHDEMKRRNDEVDFMHEYSDNVIHASNVLVRDKLNLEYKIYLEKRDDLIHTEVEKRFCLRDHVVRKMTEMQRQLNEFIDTLRNTELDAHKYERIRWLTDRQAAFVEESHKLTVEEMKFKSMLGDTQKEMTRTDLENNTTINDLRLEFQYFSNVRSRIEERMFTDDKITSDKLRLLTTESYELIQSFQKHVKRGELLLSLSQTCRKNQTQAEKIVLGGEIVDPLPELEDFDETFLLKTLNLKDHLDVTEEELVAQNKILRNFWRRQAMAEAQNVLLLDEKRHLTAENATYIEMIKTVTKTDNVDELQSAMVVSPCPNVPKRNVFKTHCRRYKLRTADSRHLEEEEDDEMHDTKSIMTTLTNITLELGPEDQVVAKL